MIKRPNSVTIISWFLIISSAINAVSTIALRNNPQVIKMMEMSSIPIPVQYIMAGVGLSITITSGLLMLKGRVLGRNLYLGWSVIGFVISMFTVPTKTMLIPSFVFLLIFCFFLFRNPAKEFFAQDKNQR